jgi:GNAT superfamily N-acetyltransferase
MGHGFSCIIWQMVSQKPVHVIRRALPADMEGLLGLYSHLNPDDPPLEPADAQEQWSALLATEIARMFVADLGGLLVSTCLLVIVPNLTRGGRPFGVIENVVTAPSYRKKGIGGGVVSAALDAAWAARCYKVMLATGTKSQATLEFYAKLGFQRNTKTFFEIRRP